MIKDQSGWISYIDFVKGIILYEMHHLYFLLNLWISFYKLYTNKEYYALAIWNNMCQLRLFFTNLLDI